MLLSASNGEKVKGAVEDDFNAITEALDDIQRAVKRFQNNRVARVVKAGDWTSSEPLNLSFHTHTENCDLVEDEGGGKVCEITNEELEKAYHAHRMALSNIRFLMGVPGALKYDDPGLELYQDAKARADAHLAKMRGAQPE